MTYEKLSKEKEIFLITHQVEKDINNLTLLSILSFREKVRNFLRKNIIFNKFLG